MTTHTNHLKHNLSSWHIFVAGVALVVAASTLVSDFNGYFALGWGFGIALLIAGVVNFLLAISAADLSSSIPRAGALYEYAKNIIPGKPGIFIGIFLGLSFYMMYGFAVSGEVSAGAYSLQALLGVDWDLRIFVVLLSVCVIIPNLLGIRETALFSAVLLLFMLGIRWFFGLAGFMGWGEFGQWSASNLVSSDGIPSLFASDGILIAGLALAFWSFVGIEFACSLAEEVEQPQKSMPKGLLWGIAAILFTSLIMGIGVTGTAPLAHWQEIGASKAACEGSCTQLAVGTIGFGTFGHHLMAISSIAATLGTVTIGLAAMSRTLYAIGDDGLLFGPKISAFFGKLHPKTKTPVNSIIFSGIVYIIPAFFSSAVVDLIYTAAYVWILMYVAYHILALLNRKLHPSRRFSMGNRITFVPYIGVLATLATLYYAFLGSHEYFGFRALVMIVAAMAIAVISVFISGRQAVRSAEADLIDRA